MNEIRVGSIEATARDSSSATAPTQISPVDSQKQPDHHPDSRRRAKLLSVAKSSQWQLLANGQARLIRISDEFKEAGWVRTYQV